MDNEPRCCSSPLADFFGRIMLLLKIAIIIVGIFMVFAGVVFCYRHYKNANDPVEATYWYIRYWGFLLCAYAIVLFFVVVLYINSDGRIFGFMDYWPAVCMLWTDNSWFAEAHHEIALSYDIFLMVFLGVVVNMAARIYGRFDWDLEVFTPSRLAMRHWVEYQIEELREKHPGHSSQFANYPRHQQEAMIAEWEIAYGKQFRGLLERQQRLLR